MTSFLKRWRKPIARRAACTAASGSSPFTWNTGAWMILATSLGYGGEAVGLGRGREADLVVDDDVDRTARPVALELGERERLRHDPLPGERRVPMHQHRDDALANGVAQAILLRPDHSFDDGIHRLEVAGVRAEREVDLGAAAGGVIARVAEVILDVAVARRLFHEEAALELGEDHLVRLVQHVGEDVQASAVRHADDHLLDALPAALFDQGVEEWNQRFSALERESLRRRIACLQELLEPLGDQHAIEDMEPLLTAEIGMIRGRLHALLQPQPLRPILHVEILDPERLAVRRLQPPEEIAESRLPATLKAPALDHPVQVGVAETELGRLEQRMPFGLGRERVQVGDQMAELAVGVHQIEDADDRLGGRRNRGARGGAGTVAAARQLESGEKQRPFLADRARIRLVTPVLLVDVSGIGARDLIQARHDFPFSVSAARPPQVRLPLHRRRPRARITG